MPKVSIVMPVYNGAKHIRESMDSILAQTFEDWEFLIINELGSDDGSAEIVKEYERNDKRFKLVQNTERLGLAESLNLGFRIAKGEYIARLDADDLAHKERLEKQVVFMDNNRDIGICGTYQHHFGDDVDWTHRSPVTPEDCKVRLLFNCVLCHSTLMLRRETVINNNLFYDNHFLAEDYELWCRASLVTKIANIPEILGEYRWDGSNITAAKRGRLNIESGKLVARNLKQNLGMELTDEECEFFQGWDNPFGRYEGIEKEEKLHKFQEVLKRIYYANKTKKVYDEKLLLSALACKWYWAKNNAPWDAEYNIQELNQIFLEDYKPSFLVRYKNFCAHNKTTGAKIKKICVVALRPFVRPFRKRLEAITWNSANNACGRIETSIIQEIQKNQDELTAHIERLTDLLDKRIEQSEQKINKTLDERVWKAEQLINQTMDGRIWKAEQLINQTMDGRIWKAEENLLKTIEDKTDAYLWNILFQLSQDKSDMVAKNNCYDYVFYLNNRYHSVLSAQHILGILFQLLEHKTIVDLGCGTGTWLWVATQLGSEEVHGYDGDYVPRNLLMIDESCFEAANLANRITDTKKYDLAISMEVGEHLPESAADTFVDNICSQADTILFSAAHPGQGGDDHINEQPQSYWVSKFASRGYEKIEIREIFKNDLKIESWYRDNMVLFAKHHGDVLREKVQQYLSTRR